MVIFGLGEASKYVLVAIAVFFFMAINSLAGALPMIEAGVRLSLGVSLLALVGAEFVGAKSGIGFLVWNSWQVFDIEAMFVGIVVIGVLGWAFFFAVDEIERRVLPWAPANRS